MYLYSSFFFFICSLFILAFTFSQQTRYPERKKNPHISFYLSFTHFDWILFIFFVFFSLSLSSHVYSVLLFHFYRFPKIYSLPNMQQNVSLFTYAGITPTQTCRKMNFIIDSTPSDQLAIQFQLVASNSICIQSIVDTDFFELIRKQLFFSLVREKSNSVKMNKCFDVFCFDGYAQVKNYFDNINIKKRFLFFISFFFSTCNKQNVLSSNDLFLSSLIRLNYTFSYIYIYRHMHFI